MALHSLAFHGRGAPLLMSLSLPLPGLSIFAATDGVPERARGRRRQDLPRRMFPLCALPRHSGDGHLLQQSGEQLLPVVLSDARQQTRGKFLAARDRHVRALGSPTARAVSCSWYRAGTAPVRLEAIHPSIHPSYISLAYRIVQRQFAQNIFVATTATSKENQQANEIERNRDHDKHIS